MARQLARGTQAQHGAQPLLLPHVHRLRLPLGACVTRHPTWLFGIPHSRRGAGVLHLSRPYLPLVIWAIGASGRTGLTLILSLSSDLLSLLTVHLYVCYLCATAVFAHMLRTVGSLWHLFRGAPHAARGRRGAAGSPRAPQASATTSSATASTRGTTTSTSSSSARSSSRSSPSSRRRSPSTTRSSPWCVPRAAPRPPARPRADAPACSCA
jgi:hypothetical protein